MLAGAGVAFGTPAAARHFLFPISGALAAPAPADFAVHALTAAYGVTVHALELRAAPGARTFVYFHNNRDTVGARVEIARAMHARGFGVLLVEYRGYGASRGGTPTEEGLYADAEAALAMLAARGVPNDRVVLWGTSLGTGVAAERARRGHGARLVLETPYTSIPDLVTDRAVIPARALVPDHFDTLAKSAEIAIPTLVLHGDADEIVPFWMGERLSRAIAGAKLIRVANGRHGDLYARDGAHLLQEVAQFSR